MESEKASDNLKSFTVLDEAGTSFAITSISPTSIDIHYNTLDGNQPGSYGNYVAIWQSNSMLPWSKTPIQVQAMTGNEQSSGDMVFKDLELTNESYLVGYSVVPEVSGVNNFCACGLIENCSLTKMIISSLRMNLESVTSNTLKLSYQALSGFNPSRYNSWVGLWKGNPDLYTSSPSHAVKVDSAQDNDMVIFDNIKILRSSTYTAAFVMNGWDKDIPKLTLTGVAYRITFKT